MGGRRHRWLLEQRPRRRRHRQPHLRTHHPKPGRFRQRQGNISDRHAGALLLARIAPGLGVAFPNPTTTFCVELTQHISTGNTYTYTETPLAATPGVSGTEATLISQLWGDHFNAAWESSSFTGSDSSTAFQLALWELVYDSGSNLSLSSGNLKVTSASSNAVALAKSWLNGLSSLSSNEFATNFAGSQLVWLSNSYKQDQLTMLPLPWSPPPPPPGGSPPPPPPPPRRRMAYRDRRVPCSD